MKVYIAGPMRGYPSYNFAAFYHAEKWLRDSGFEVFNPARIDQENGFDPLTPEDQLTQEDMDEFIRRDVNIIMNKVDAVYMLRGWEKSTGAKAELALATWKRLLIMYEDPPMAPPDAAKEKTEGYRDDGAKPDWSLVPMHLMDGMVRVLEFGAKKYSRSNWRKGMHWSRLTNSLQRHLNAFNAGEDIDTETGLPHVDHIMCNALFLSGAYQEHKSLDDRYQPPQQ